MTRSTIWLTIAILAASFAASPSSAQNAPAPVAPAQDIVVMGQRLKDVLRQFVTSTTQTGPTDQIAHWDREICPKMFGIADAQADYVTRRIAQVAKTVGVRTGKGTCPTMLEIIVTADPATLAKAVADAYPADNWKVRAPLHKFATSQGPVRWISVTDEGGGALPNTRLTKATRARLHAMIIIVDANRLAGFSIGPLSDYLALVALSNPPLEAPRAQQSILTLFDKSGSDSVSATLTDYDLSFLVGLYGVREDFGAESQRSSIVSRMARELRKGVESSPATSTAPQN